VRYQPVQTFREQFFRTTVTQSGDAERRDTRAVLLDTRYLPQVAEKLKAEQFLQPVIGVSFLGNVPAI